MAKQNKRAASKRNKMPTSSENIYNRLGSGSSDATPSTSSFSSPGQSPERKFLVVDNADDGSNNTWSLILTDDESQSTSSSETGSINADDADLLSDDEPNERESLNSGGRPTTDDQPESGIPGKHISTPGNRISGKRHSQDISQFEVPKIQLQSKGATGCSRKCNLQTWVKLVTALLTLVMVPAGIYQYSRFSVPVDIQLIDPPASVCSPVVLRTTVTHMAVLPRETVTKIVYFSPAFELHVAEVSTAFQGYVDRLKNTKTAEKMARIGQKLGLNLPKIQHAGHVTYSMISRVMNQAGVESQRFYTKTSPIVSLYAARGKQYSLKIGNAVASQLEMRFANAKKSALEFEYAKNYNNVRCYVTRMTANSIEGANQLTESAAASSNVAYKKLQASLKKATKFTKEGYNSLFFSAKPVKENLWLQNYYLKLRKTTGWSAKEKTWKSRYNSISESFVKRFKQETVGILTVANILWTEWEQL